MSIYREDIVRDIFKKIRMSEEDQDGVVSRMHLLGLDGEDFQTLFNRYERELSNVHRMYPNVHYRGDSYHIDIIIPQSIEYVVSLMEEGHEFLDTIKEIINIERQTGRF